MVRLYPASRVKAASMLVGIVLTVPACLVLSHAGTAQEDPGRAGQVVTRDAPRATLRGHDWSPAWTVAYSPDGKTLASACGLLGDNPGRLKLWDVDTMRERAIQKEDREVKGLAYSPDGKALATGGMDKAVRLRDPDTGSTSLSIPFESEVNGIAYSPDGGLLALAHWDNTITLWDLKANRAKATLRGHSQGVWSVAFSPDGKRLASGSGDQSVRLWDVADARELAVIKGHADQVESVAFSPDGSTLASASWDKTVKLWDAATGEELATLKGHTVQALGLAFSPDGKTLASSSGRWGDYNYTPGPGEVILWNLANRRPYAIFKGHPDRIFSVAFSPDGKTVASACCDGSIRLWDVPERK